MLWLAAWLVLVCAQKDAWEKLSTELCVEKAEAALWDSAEPQGLPSSLSPAVRGDRLRVAEVKGPLAQVTAKSFFPRLVWIEKNALGPCALATEGATTSLAAEVTRARALVRSLRAEVVACAEADSGGCEEVQQRLLRATEQLRRLCDADPACAAARKTRK